MWKSVPEITALLIAKTPHTRLSKYVEGEMSMSDTEQIQSCLKDIFRWLPAPLISGWWMKVSSLSFLSEIYLSLNSLRDNHIPSATLHCELVNFLLDWIHYCTRHIPAFYSCPVWYGKIFSIRNSVISIVIGGNVT